MTGTSSSLASALSEREISEIRAVLTCAGRHELQVVDHHEAELAVFALHAPRARAQLECIQRRGFVDMDARLVQARDFVGQPAHSSSVSRPVRNRVWSTFAMEESMRMASWLALISMLKMATGRLTLGCSATCSAMLSAKSCPWTVGRRR